MAQQIPVNVSKEWGRKLRRYRDLLLEVYNLGLEVRAKMAQGVLGEDYTELEEQFGLQEGDGELAQAETNSIVGKLDTDAEVTNIKSALTQYAAIIG